MDCNALTSDSVWIGFSNWGPSCLTNCTGRPIASGIVKISPTWYPLPPDVTLILTTWLSKTWICNVTPLPLPVLIISLALILYVLSLASVGVVKVPDRFPIFKLPFAKTFKIAFEPLLLIVFTNLPEEVVASTWVYFEKLKKIMLIQMTN